MDPFRAGYNFKHPNLRFNFQIVVNHHRVSVAEYTNSFGTRSVIKIKIKTAFAI